MLFRKFLVRIRKEYNTEKKRLFIYSSIALIVSALLGVLVDAFLPFEGGWNILRSAVLVPTSVSIFILGYAISLDMHYKKIRDNPDWIPFRSRMSPTWRRRISAIVAAFAFIFVYANGYRIGYTFVSSLFVAAVIAIFAFMRTTREEANREEFDIPDVRDTHYETHRRKLAADRVEAQRLRDKQKQDKKNKSKNTDD